MPETPAFSLQDLVSVPEAASRLGTTRTTIHRWIKRFGLPAIVLGNRPFVSWETVRDWPKPRPGPRPKKRRDVAT